MSRPAMVRRPPAGPLKPFFSLVWACGRPERGALPGPVREHMLPTGCMHLVFRMTDGPMTTLDPRSGMPVQRVGTATVAGARPGFYVRERCMPVCSVGAVLRPGAAKLLFGVSAAELTARHTPLEDLWGAAAAGMRNRLLDVDECLARLALLESMLAARLAHVDPGRPAIGRALASLPARDPVAAAVRRSGLSHRSFIARVRESVGLAPKRYLRILRFQKALHALRAGDGGSLAMHAAQAGYSDQAHLSRDFLELSGVTPREYLRRFPVEPNHLQVAPLGGTPGQIPSRPPRRHPR